MNGSRRFAAFVLSGALLFAAGCRSAGTRTSVAASEPTLVLPGDSPTTIVESPTPRAITFVDRHPLLSRPREYYETSGDNRLVKLGAATLVGIPAGFVGEIRQIVVGRPPATASY